MIEEHYSTLFREEKKYDLDYNGLVKYLFNNGQPNLETTKINLTRNIFTYDSVSVILDYVKNSFDTIILKIDGDTKTQEKKVFDELDDILLVEK